MPVYDFECALCGDFPVVLSISGRDKPMECPECGLEARRMVSAPNLALMNSGRRKAFAVNERSAHAPRVSSGHSCNTGCGCGSKIRKGRSRKTHMGVAQTTKSGARPWMLGH